MDEPSRSMLNALRDSWRASSSPRSRLLTTTHLSSLALRAAFPGAFSRVAILTTTSQCETVNSHSSDLASWAQGLRGVVP